MIRHLANMIVGIYAGIIGSLWIIVLFLCILTLQKRLLSWFESKFDRLPEPRFYK